MTSPKKNILIYNDEGADARGVYNLFHNLHKAMDPNCRILVVDGSYFTQTDWEKTTQLLIIPGGRARPYYEIFGTEWESKQVSPGEMHKIKNIGPRNQRIKGFVENGGSYLGICAGAYYACDHTQFELGNALEVYDQGLGLAHYAAIGPAYGLGKFRYDNEEGAQLAKINGKICTGNQQVYFNGGCFFKPLGNNHSEDNVLFRFADIADEPIAAIHTHYGKGAVILTGTHPEFIPEKGASRDELIQQLSPHYPHNQKLLTQMLQLLGVPLK